MDDEKEALQKELATAQAKAKELREILLAMPIRALDNCSACPHKPKKRS
jgi:hypothetical protein